MYRQRQNDIIRVSAEASGLKLTSGEIRQLEQYATLVMDWNQKINLVSRRDVGNLIDRHIVDSLAPLRFWDGLGLPPQPEVMDLGSGGGFPGIPLKICRPEIHLTCVEATQKKATFLDLAYRELALQNVMVIPRHSQELVKEKELAGKYDMVVCRAVAELKELVKIAFPFIKPGGLLLAFKGQKAEEETKSAEATINKLSGKIIPTAIKVSVSDKKPKIILVKKGK